MEFLQTPFGGADTIIKPIKAQRLFDVSITFDTLHDNDLTLRFYCIQAEDARTVVEKVTDAIGMLYDKVNVLELTATLSTDDEGTLRT